MVATVKSDIDKMVIAGNTTSQTHSLNTVQKPPIPTEDGFSTHDGLIV
jgi:hypothetical protein